MKQYPIYKLKFEKIENFVHKEEYNKKNKQS